MTATVLVHGTIRQTSPKATRATGENFGTEVSILTEVGATLGETLRVLVFNPRRGETPPAMEVGRIVSWVIEVDASASYLNGTFRRTASEEDFRALAAGLGTPAWDLDAPLAGADDAERVSA